MANTTLTRSGETWDQIAKRTLGSENLCHLLMDANFKYMNVATFDVGTELIVPDITYTQQADLNLPPWRK